MKIAIAIIFSIIFFISQPVLSFSEKEDSPENQTTIQEEVIELPPPTTTTIPMPDTVPEPEEKVPPK